MSHKVGGHYLFCFIKLSLFHFHFKNPKRNIYIIFVLIFAL